MGILVISCLISLGIIWAASAMARSRSGGKARVILFSFVATVPFLFCFSPALALQCVLTAVFTMACAAFRWKPRSVFFAAVGAMIASYGLVIGMSVSELHTLARLREKYPVESLSNRLAYESRGRGVRPDAAVEPQERHFSSDVELHLAKFDAESFHGRSNMRQYMLSSLHVRSADAFVVARGFGPVRMLGVRAERIELPEPGPIPLPSPTEQYVPDHESSLPIVEENVPDRQQPGRNGLVALHSEGLEDLFDSGRMGYVRDRDHVAGFLSHRFTRMPGLAREDQPQSAWQVVRLELVSLLRHEDQAAYVSKNLPEMDRLEEIPTRALNDFERRSIERLRSQEDVVIDEAPDRIQMVGSLRAAKSCLQCHSVQRGDLLGALTYELAPVNPVRGRATKVVPPEL
jgi:hypothetical protein